MKLSHVAALSALIVSAFGATVKRNDPDIDIEFTKFENESCEDGNTEEIESGDCRNFDYKFRSFKYMPKIHDVRWWHHNDFDDDRCSVVV